jgi:AcrR family transcriptional regulator
VSRWAPDAAERLRVAAMELFAEHGFADTTVPQIAARAGLTTRTFFRHYPDKREVLFVGENELPAVVARVFAQAPAELAPLEVVVHGLRTVVAPRLQDRHAYFRARRAIVDSDPGVQEREAHKLAGLGRAATTGFTERGLSAPQAGIAAALAVTVYDAAFNTWLDGDPTTPFADAVTTAAATLRAIATG